MKEGRPASLPKHSPSNDHNQRAETPAAEPGCLAFTPISATGLRRLLNNSNIGARLPNRLTRRARLRQLFQLGLKRIQDIRASPRGTEHHLPTATRGDDERGRLVVESVTVSVWTDGFGAPAVEICGAFLGAVVGACAAVAGGVAFCAGGEARVEDGALDIVVWIGVDAVAGFGGLCYLEVPRTPTCDLGISLTCFPGNGI